MLKKSSIIVLHTIKHGETGLVVQCYSNTNGKQALYLRGGTKANIKSAKFHRLNILDIITYSNSVSSMPQIREFTQASALNSIRTNIYKNTIAIFISEIIVRTIRESEANPQLFTFVKTAIEILEQMERGIANFHLYFLVQLAGMLGFKPLNNYSEKTPLFNISLACFTEPFLIFDGNKCIISEESSSHLTTKESYLLHQILNTQFTQIESIICNGELRLSFAKKIISYLSYHLGISIEIKSLDVLHEVFN